LIDDEWQMLMEEMEKAKKKVKRLNE